MAAGIAACTVLSSSLHSLSTVDPSFASTSAYVCALGKLSAAALTELRIDDQSFAQPVPCNALPHAQRLCTLSCSDRSHALAGLAHAAQLTCLLWDPCAAPSEALQHFASFAPAMQQLQRLMWSGYVKDERFGAALACLQGLSHAELDAAELARAGAEQLAHLLGQLPRLHTWALRPGVALQAASLQAAGACSSLRCAEVAFIWQQSNLGPLLAHGDPLRALSSLTRLECMPDGESCQLSGSGANIVRTDGQHAPVRARL